MNYHYQDDDVITISAPAGGVVSGQFVQIGALHGFALDAAAEGAPVALMRKGRVLDAPKGNVAVTAGDPLYFDSVDKVFTNASPPDSDPVAVAVSDAVQAAATVDLVLVSVAGGGGGGGGGEPDIVTVTVAQGEVTGTSPADPEHVGWEAIAWVPAGADVGLANIVVNQNGSVTVTTLETSVAGSTFKVLVMDLA